MNRRYFFAVLGALLLSWGTSFACHKGDGGNEGNGKGNDSGSDSGDSGSDSGGDSVGADNDGGNDAGLNDGNGNPCDEIDRDGWPGDPYRRPCRRPKLNPIW